MVLPQPLPDLDALDLLVTVSELGSISAAAAAHRVTASSPTSTALYFLITTHLLLFLDGPQHRVVARSPVTPWVECVKQPVAEQVEGEHEE